MDLYSSLCIKLYITGNLCSLILEKYPASLSEGMDLLVLISL